MGRNDATGFVAIFTAYILAVQRHDSCFEAGRHLMGFGSVGCFEVCVEIQIKIICCGGFYLVVSILQFVDGFLRGCVVFNLILGLVQEGVEIFAFGFAEQIEFAGPCVGMEFT